MEWSSGLKAPAVLLLLVVMVTGPALSVNECMSGKEIDCFDCNSHTDPRCGDPFVFTAHTRDMPPVKQCDGCCVKLVQHRGTEYESVRRTCTDEIDINLFMVDHVCMTEGGKDGIMCFCEENKCNTASSRPLLTLPTLLATTIFYNVLNGDL